MDFCFGRKSGAEFSGFQSKFRLKHDRTVNFTKYRTVAITQQIVFILVLGAAGYFIRKRVLRISDNIRLGKKNEISGHQDKRLGNVLLVAFGQKKMFKRFIPAFFHFFIYFGFLVINLEVLEFIIDGILGTHRVFAPFLGGIYGLLMNTFEFLAVAVLVSCVAFLVRRNVMKLPRFWSAEMTKWPRLDANLILVIEIALMVAILLWRPQGVYPVANR